MKKHVILTANGGRYGVWIHYAATCWAELGYQVHQLVLPGVDRRIAKLARFPTRELGILDFDFVVMSDADMIVFRDPFPCAHDLDALSWHSVGKNLYDGTVWEPRWPMCYLGARAGMWYMFADQWPHFAGCGMEANGNFSDELIFKEYIMAKGLQVHTHGWRQCQIDRYERQEVAVDELRFRAHAIDAHCPEPSATAIANVNRLIRHHLYKGA